MDALQKPDITCEDRADLYEYIERRGRVEPETARRALDMGKRAFGHHVAALKRDDAIEEESGKLRIAFDAGAQEAYDRADLSFRIRQACEEDLAGLVDAIREAVGDGEYLEAEAVADTVDTEGVLTRHNEIESRIFFVACVGDDVVGWLHLKHTGLGKLGHTAAFTLGVLESYRGRGIGSQLLERAVDWAGDQGLEKLYNAVPATNETALDFLESRGLETEAIREGHYKLDGSYVDEVMMARRV